MPEAVQVCCTADGIGDALLGLTATAGLTRDGKRVIYALLGSNRRSAPWQESWVRLFDGYDCVTTGPIQGLPCFCPHDTYDTQNRTRLARPRWQHYADACHTRAVLPWPRPLSREAIDWATPYKGCIVFSPFSCTENRAWLTSHWLALERLWVESGGRVVVLDGWTDAKTRTHAFRSVVLRDEPADRVAAVLAVADGYVGQDSGMSHLAGLLRVPSIVLAAQIKGEAIFGLYPTVKIINGPLACGGCHWQGTAGWHPVCDQLCANLQSIRPEAVFRALQNARRSLPGRLHDPAADRALDAVLMRLQPPYPDRRATFDAFLAHLRDVDAPLLVETGCQRSHDDDGAGSSTTLLGRYLASKGGKLVSVDNDVEHAQFARKVAGQLPVEVVTADSVGWLRAAGGAHGVYLDSMDTWVPGYQDHCLAEAQAAARITSLILIDDTFLLSEGKWDGKGAKAVPWLLAQGWKVALQGYQTLLTGPVTETRAERNLLQDPPITERDGGSPAAPAQIRDLLGG